MRTRRPRRLRTQMPDQNRESELPIFVKWMDFLKWLMPVMDRLPKKVRFTLSNRISNLALDLVEDLVEARYSRNKTTLLRGANLKLEKLRVLMRISFESGLIPMATFKHSAMALNEVGKMLGGWLKQQEART